MVMEIAAPITVPKVLFVAAIRGRAKSIPIMIIRKVITVIDDASLWEIALQSQIRNMTPKTQTKISALEENKFAFIRLKTMEVIPPSTEPIIRLMPNSTELFMESCKHITDAIQAKLGDEPKR